MSADKEDDVVSTKPKSPAMNVAPALLDVLIRGLESARQNLNEGDDKTPREFCALAYAQPGELCWVAYYHRPQ